MEGVTLVCIGMLITYFMYTYKRRLLILDLNDVLICRKHISDVMKHDIDTTHAIRKGNMFFWARPGVDIFLRWCTQRFDVAVWSSMAKHNLNIALSVLDFKPMYVWDQSHCCRVTPHPDPRSTKPDCLTKPLAGIHKNDKLFLWYSCDNIYIVDNCPYKMKYNAEKNVVLVDAWDIYNDDDMGLYNLFKKLKKIVR